MVTDYIYDIKKVITEVKTVNRIEFKCDKCGKTLIVLKPTSDKDDSTFKIDYLLADEAKNHPNFWWIYIEDTYHLNENTGYRNYQLICEECFKEHLGTYVLYLDDKPVNVFKSRIIISNPLDIITKDAIFIKECVEFMFTPSRSKELNRLGVKYDEIRRYN